MTTKISNFTSIENCLMILSDKNLLSKKAIVETVTNKLRNICYVDHFRHRLVISSRIPEIIVHQFLLTKSPTKSVLLNTNKLTLY
jgi:hypothetical protein